MVVVKSELRARFSLFSLALYFLCAALFTHELLAVHQQPVVFFGSQLHLPGFTGGYLKYPHIYQIKSNAYVPTQKQWSCGFHALYNMCNVERQLGISYVQDYQFAQVCQQVVRNPHGYSTNYDMWNIAKKLGLQSVPYLMMNGKNEIIPCYKQLTFSYQINTGMWDSPNNFVNAFNAALLQREKAFWNNVRMQLQRPGNQCVHFACHVMYGFEPHVVLMSAIKLADGRYGLYVFDNVNDQEPRGTQRCMKAYAEHIYKKVLL